MQVRDTNINVCSHVASLLSEIRNIGYTTKKGDWCFSALPKQTTDRKKFRLSLKKK